MANQTSNPRERFFMVPNDVIDYYGKALGAYGMTIYMVLKRHEGWKTKKCYPTFKTIRKLTGFSRDTIIDYLKLLESLKLISISKRKNASNGNMPNLYTILPPQVPVPDHIFNLHPKEFSHTQALKIQSAPYQEEHSLQKNVHSSEKFSQSVRKNAHNDSQPNLLPQSNSSTTQSIPSKALVGEMDSNKTYQQDEINKTHFNQTAEGYLDKEFIRPTQQALTAVFPSLEEAQFKFIWEKCLKKKGGDPVAAKKWLDAIIKSAQKQSKGIHTPFPWFMSMVDIYSPKFKKTSITPCKMMANLAVVSQPKSRSDKNGTNLEKLEI
jgi:hypothetical protein